MTALLAKMWPYIMPVLASTGAYLLHNVANMLVGQTLDDGGKPKSKMRAVANDISFTTPRNEPWTKVKLPRIPLKKTKKKDSE